MTTNYPWVQDTPFLQQMASIVDRNLFPEHSQSKQQSHHEGEHGDDIQS